MHQQHHRQHHHQQLGRRLVRRVVLTVLLCSFFGELGHTHPGQEGVGGRVGGFSGVLVKAAPQQNMSHDSREEKKRQREKKQQQAQEQYNEYMRLLEEGANNQNSNNGKATATTLDASTVFGAIFPTKKPRHILEALKNAFQSIAIGSTLGGLSFMLMPVAGWYQSAAMNAANNAAAAAEAANANSGGSDGSTGTVTTSSKSGLAGLFAGAIAGSITGATMTILGIVNGSYQVVTGIYTTFAAVTAAWQGTRIWDEVAEAWVVYDLKIEMDELSASVYNKNGNSNVREMGYYDLLQVPSSATPKEIKKAYYRLAKELHPDKNPGNDQAAEQFRHLHTVYRILSDDEKRATYDSYGEKSVDDDSGATAFLQQFDPFTFFAVLFGSQLVETYIGELAMPSVVDQLMKLNPADVSSRDVTDNMLLNGSDYKKRKRQVDISVNLLERVRDFVDGNVSKEAFRESCKTEAEHIAESPFGEEFLVSIGSTLAWEAGQYFSFSRPVLGWTAGSYYFTRKQTRRLYYGASMAFKAVSFVRSAYVAFQKGLDEDAPIPNMTPEQYAQEQVEEMLPEMLELAWSFNMMDISSTLNGVCRRLFADAGADALTRKKRAEAIQMLGKEFLKRGNSNNSDSATRDKNASCKATERDAESIKARLEVAFQASLMKASGQDVPKDSEEMIKRSRSNNERKKA